MFKQLKDLTNRNPVRNLKGYTIVKYPHPSSDLPPSDVRGFDTLEEAQEYCSRPESSYKEGPKCDWYFLGYVENSSRTAKVTLW